LRGLTLNIYTEDFPPFNFLENNKVTGASTEIVQEIMKEAGFSYQIHTLPWARTLKVAEKEKGALIYSISRTEKRENLYTWIDTIVPVEYTVYALKKQKQIKIGSLEEMKKYRIGTTRGDARESFLLASGFRENNFELLAGKDSYFRNFRKLKSGKIDLWPMPVAVATWLLKNKNIDIHQTLTPAYRLREMSGSYYLAANKQISPDILEGLKKAITKLRKSGFLDQVAKKWQLTNP